MLRMALGAVWFVLAGLFALFPFLHLRALWAMWGTSEVPQNWLQNLGVAVCIGILGGFGLYEGWRMFCRTRPPVADSNGAAGKP